MSHRPFVALWFLLGGGILALLSLVLWFALPLHLGYPPYLPTAFLMIAYGGGCLLLKRFPENRKS